MSVLSTDPSPDFNFSDWLQQRASNPDFLMVELGHGLYPAAINQSFEGGRAYVGLETYGGWPSFWIKTARDKIDILRRHRPDENLFFLEQPSIADSEGVEPSIIPDGVASEAYLSNVLTSPDVKDMVGILSEATRMTKPSGNVVIRETFTPYDFRVKSAIKKLGMCVVGESNYGDANWAALELAYSSAGVNSDYNQPPSPKSFYWILQL